MLFSTACCHHLETSVYVCSGSNFSENWGYVQVGFSFPDRFWLIIAVHRIQSTYRKLLAAKCSSQKTQNEQWSLSQVFYFIRNAIVLFYLQSNSLLQSAKTAYLCCRQFSTDMV